MMMPRPVRRLASFFFSCFRSYRSLFFAPFFRRKARSPLSGDENGRCVHSPPRLSFLFRSEIAIPLVRARVEICSLAQARSQLSTSGALRAESRSSGTHLARLLRQTDLLVVHADVVPRAYTLDTCPTPLMTTDAVPVISIERYFCLKCKSTDRWERLNGMEIKERAQYLIRVRTKSK